MTDVTTEEVPDITWKPPSGDWGETEMAILDLGDRTLIINYKEDTVTDYAVYTESITVHLNKPDNSIDIEVKIE